MGKIKSAVVRLYNRSRQLISIQVKPPKGDFYMHEQTVHLHPKKTVTLPKSHLNHDQISNLQKKRIIQVLFDSESRKNVPAGEE